MDFNKFAEQTGSNPVQDLISWAGAEYAKVSENIKNGDCKIDNMAAHAMDTMIRAREVLKVMPPINTARPEVKLDSAQIADVIDLVISAERWMKEFEAGSDIKMKPFVSAVTQEFQNQSGFVVQSVSDTLWGMEKDERMKVLNENENWPKDIKECILIDLAQRVDEDAFRDELGIKGMHKRLD